jgi:signal-transduction protein with cAMP-binding, CBS, and nucleotidyltransferase domain
MSRTGWWACSPCMTSFSSSSRATPASGRSWRTSIRQACFSDLVGRVKYIQVGDLMTPEVVTVEPDTHLMVIVDVMIKRHIRRLPVVSGGDVVGIVYISVSIQK